MGSDIKDGTTKLNLISPDAWLKHYQNLRRKKSSPLNLGFSDNLEEESIKLEELMGTMAKIKNYKTPGDDGLNIEPFKYSIFKFFFILIWNSKEPPTRWSKSIVISIYKKRR